MKTRVLSLLLISVLFALAARSVHGPAAGDEDFPKPGSLPEKYQDTVQKGLAYLARNQFPDGHWEGDGGNHPVAMTGLAGLAFLMDGEGPRYRRTPRQLNAKHEGALRRAADWLMDKCHAGRDGLLYSGHASETSRYMEGHGLATLFLAGVFACEDDDPARHEKLGRTLERAVKFIAKSQSSQGGWHHTSKIEGHDFDTIPASVIQVQALQAAANAGIALPGDIINDGQQYLTTSLDKIADKDRKPAEMAAVFACRLSSGFYPDKPNDWPTGIRVGRDINLARDELTHFYFAQAYFQASQDGHKAGWSDYFAATFDHLQNSQNKDGSWPGAEGISAGPVYATAVWCTVLQLERSCYPSMRRLTKVK